MPTVPSYTRVVSDNQLPGVMVSFPGDQNTFGGNVAQATGSIGNDLMRAGEQLNNQQVLQQHQDNLQAVQNALAGATKEISDYHYNENDGFLHRMGENAKGITNSSEQLSNAVAYKYANDLTNPAQKQAFMQAITPQIQSFTNAAQNHEAQQNTIALKQSSDAMGTAYAGTAATAYNQPDIADNAFRMGIKNVVASGMALGVPQEAIKQNISKYSADVVTQMVKTALDVNDINGASTALQRYGDKLDGYTAAALTEAITKKAIPIRANQISDDLFAKYGLDEKSGMDELRQQYEGDPGYKSYVAAYQARLVDERRFKNDADKKNQENVLAQVWQAGSLEEAQNIIENANIKPSQKLYLLNMSKGKFKALAGKPTADQRYWAGYERRGLTSDLETIRAFEKITQDGDPTPTQQKSANIAADRLNKYWTFSSGGGYDPGAAEEAKWQESFQSNPDYVEPSGNSRGKAKITSSEYDFLINSGFDKDEINSKYDVEG